MKWGIEVRGADTHTLDEPALIVWVNNGVGKSAAAILTESKMTGDDPSDLVKMLEQWIDGIKKFAELPIDHKKEAAPDMYAALEELLDSEYVSIFSSAMESESWRLDLKEWEVRARAALAKARGGVVERECQFCHGRSSTCEDCMGSGVIREPV